VKSEELRAESEEANLYPTAYLFNLISMLLVISNIETPRNKMRIEIMAEVRSCLFRAFSCFVRWDTQKEKINLLCEIF